MSRRSKSLSPAPPVLGELDEPVDGGGAELLEVEPPNGELPKGGLLKEDPDDGALGVKLLPLDGNEDEEPPPIRVT